MARRRGLIGSELWGVRVGIMTIRLRARAMIAMRAAIAGGVRASASTTMTKTMAARGAAATSDTMAAIKAMAGAAAAKSYFGVC